MFKYDLGNYVQFKEVEDETGKSYSLKEGTILRRNFQSELGWVYEISGSEYFVAEEDILGKTEKPAPSQYLIWVNTGSTAKEYTRYKICTGITEEEAVKDWFIQTRFSLDTLDKSGDNWLDDGYVLSVIKLLSTDETESRKTLKWVSTNTD